MKIKNEVHICDNITLLNKLDSECVDLIYCDILYGTGKKFKDYNSERANKVVDYVRNFLNEIAPLEKIDWKEISKIFIEKNTLLFLSGSA